MRDFRYDLSDYERLERIKEYIKEKDVYIQNIINRLIEILEAEQGCNEGDLTEYDIIKIYEELTKEVVL